MPQCLLKLFLIGLLRAAWPGHVDTESLECRGMYLRKVANQDQVSSTSKAAVREWSNPNGPTQFEKAMSLFVLALLVLGTVALIAGLIEGGNVFTPILIVGLSMLYLFIMSRVVTAREKKARKSPRMPRLNIKPDINPN